MALINCPECGGKVSTAATTCPHCGYPIASLNQSAAASPSQKTAIPKSKYKYSECKPSEYEIKRKNFKYSGKATAIIIPDEVTLVSKSSFKDVKAVYLGKNVDTISKVDVEWFDVSEENPNFSTVDGVLFNKEKTEIIRYPSLRAEKEYTIPLYVKTIKKHAFSNDRKIETIVLHDNLDIEESAFSSAKKLKTIRWNEGQYPDNSWPPNVKMTNAAFESCQISSITFLDGIRRIENSFSSSAIKSVTIPPSVKELARSCFSFCKSLKHVDIQGTITLIPDCCFIACEQLESVTIPDSVIEFGSGCFNGCHSLQTISIPPKTREIGPSAFYSCEQLSNIVLPDGLQSIGESAFRWTKIEKIVIPDSVTSYGSIFEDIKNVSISSASLENMSETDKQRKLEAEKKHAKDEAWQAEVQASLARIDKLTAELTESIEKKDFFVFQKDARRLVQKREQNKKRLEELKNARNYPAYNSLLLETYEINKIPIYEYKECGKSVKLYRRNGVDCSFALELDGIVYALNLLQESAEDFRAGSSTDASQLDKGIMMGIAGSSLLGYLATGFAQIYNTIDAGFTFVNKKTGRRLPVIFGDNYRVNSKDFDGIMDKIQRFYNLMSSMTRDVSNDETMAANYIENSYDEILSLL